MLGGMALPTRENLAEQYFDAAQVLIGAVKRGDIEDCRLVRSPLVWVTRVCRLNNQSVSIARSLIGGGGARRAA